MVSELIVMIIIGKGNSDEAWQFLEKNRGGGLFRLIDIVRIRHDTIGKISYLRWKQSDQLINKHNRLAAAFAEVIFDISRAEDRRQLVGAGLDPFFLRKVIQTLIPDSLAYLLHVPRESLIDSRRFLEILEAQEGDIYHTTFQSQVEEVLLKQND